MTSTNRGALQPASSEPRFLTTSSIRTLLQRTVVTAAKQKLKNRSHNARSDGENVPPPDPNICSSHELEKAKREIVEKETREVVEVERKVLETVDPAVKVVVRIRPESVHERGGDWRVKRVGEDTVCVGERSFGFDSVFDAKSNQEAIFQSVGVPVVKNALDGYNTSILSYGQRT